MRSALCRRSRRVSFNPDGSQLAAASVYTPVGSVVDVATGAEVLSLEGHTRGIGDIEWSPNGQAIATAGTDGSARVFDAESGAENLVFPHGANGIDWDPDSNRLATAGLDGTVKVWVVIEGGDRGSLPRPCPRTTPRGRPRAWPFRRTASAWPLE